MEHTESYTTDPEKRSSETHIGSDAIVGYRNGLSTDEIFYLEPPPPPYESIQTDAKDPKRQIACTQARLEQRHCCYRNRLRIAIAIGIAIILILLILAIALALGLRREIPCDISSASGKSCERSTSAKSVTLLRLPRGTPGNQGLMFYSYGYTGQSNSDVITFAFEKGSSWYLDDISVIDTSTSTELMQNGDFETGSLDAYCACSGRLEKRNYYFPIRSVSYVYDSWNTARSSKLSQSLETISGRNYNVSFWLNNPMGGKSSVTVSMSKANQNAFHIIFLLLTVFLFHII